MDVYFARHGETVSNTNRTIQGQDDVLTDKGIAEAETLANRIKDAAFDSVLTSPLIRCIQTAEVYSSLAGMSCTKSDLFTELRPNSSLVGKTMADPEVAEANLEREQNTHDEHWKSGDEESFSEFRARAVEALSYLESLSDKEFKNVLVFTHGKFLRALIGIIMFGSAMTKDEYAKIAHIFYIQNASITKLTFKKSDGRKPNRWRIVHWNDCSHILS